MAVEVQLNPHTKGDQWPGIAMIGPITVDGVAPAETLVRVRMHFRKAGDASNAFGYGLDSNVVSGAGTITIDDAVNWNVIIPEQGLTLDAGMWNWDMEFYRNGVTLPWTLFKGVLEVQQDYTF